jgi:hypothetical protein
MSTISLNSVNYASISTTNNATRFSVAEAALTAEPKQLLISSEIIKKDNVSTVVMFDEKKLFPESCDSKELVSPIRSMIKIQYNPNVSPASVLAQQLDDLATLIMDANFRASIFNRAHDISFTDAV